MNRLLVTVALILALLAVGSCGGGEDDSEEADFAMTVSTSAASDAFMAMDTMAESAEMRASGVPAQPMAPAAAMADGQATGASGGTVQLADRKIISTGDITIEVEDVPAAVEAVEALADSMGGYVEMLSSSGVEESSRASLTIRVPQGQFGSVYDRIRELGQVLRERQGSEDVSEQFIDLEARLNSAKREEQSFLSLLGRTSNVGEVLAIERELARVRADIERYQGQLDFLTRRVDLSTIYVELVPEEGPFIDPPHAYLRIAVDDVSDNVDEARQVIASLGGEIDRGTVFDEDGRAFANLNARVFSDDFRATVEALERLGSVESKSVQEPILRPEGGEEKDPSASIELRLEERDRAWLIWAAIAVSVTAVLVLIIALLWRRARRRAAA